MFQIDDCKLQRLWNLSQPEETEVVIPEDRLKLLQNHDLLPIHFLYQNHRKNYKGAILNEQNGFNMQLQVSVFLTIMLRYIEQKFLTLVLAPEYLMTKWYQYLTDIAGLETIRVNSKTCPEDFDDKHGVALLSSFDDIKLLEHLIGYNYFAIVIDCFDEVANKLIIKKLYGDFHIGLTTRNFYSNPDQRLQWIMLDWCSPRCCGESKNFQQIDNDNFANFRDNYRYWWFRLTRHFCDSLKDIVSKEKVTQLKTITKKPARKQKKTVKKSNIREECKKQDVKIEEESMEAETLDNVEIKIETIKQTATLEQSFSEKNKSDLSKSQQEDLKMKSEGFKTNLPQIDDDDPINLLLSTSDNQVSLMEPFTELNSFKSEQTENLSPKAKDLSVKTKQLVVKPEELSKESKESENLTEDKGDILLSLMDEENQMEQSSSLLDPESEILFKKQELLTQIFSEVPSTSTQSIEKEESTEFLMSLIDD